MQKSRTAVKIYKILAISTLMYVNKTGNNQTRQIQNHSWRDKIRGTDSEVLWKD
jgi:hypothetical protein